MKKNLALFILLIIAFTCYSQSDFGIFAGAQTTTAKYTIAEIKQPTEYKYGFQAGFGWKIPFDNHLFFSPAAFYSLKGYKVKFNRYAFPPDTTAVNNNTSIHTFELAFLLQLDMGNRPTHFFMKAGPSIDFQLFGKEKFNVKTGGLTEHAMKFDFTAYGHYSANLLLQLGLETGNGFVIFGQYGLGLGNINNADRGPSIKHRLYGISLGKYFRKKKIVLDTRNKE